MSAAAFSLPAGDVRSPKTAELLAHRLRRMIVTGELRHGDYLPLEGELMVYFRVSRPTLREAVRILEAESLVEVRRGSRTGAMVRIPGPEMLARPVGLLLQLAGTTLAEVLEARLGIEPLAVALLTGRGTTEATARAYAQLDDVVAGVKADVAEGRPPGENFARFHETVVEQSGNRALAITVGMLEKIVSRHVAAATMSPGRMEPDEVGERYRGAIKAYERLIALMRSGRAPEAERFWRRYLESANRSLLRGYEPDAVIDILE